jgi:hypothetical protein
MVIQLPVQTPCLVTKRLTIILVYMAGSVGLAEKICLSRIEQMKQRGLRIQRTKCTVQWSLRIINVA